MNARRAGVAGIETEYGISVAGLSPDAAPDAISLSEAVVRTVGRGENAWSAAWNYADEQPLVDARGTVLDRRLANPDLLTDVVHHANVLLGNGARVYVDHAHPEHSGPEVTSARDAVIWDRAGDQVMQRAAERAGAASGLDIRLHKNTTDGKGHSYGCHENHLVPRAVPFDAIVRGFSAFLASRVVVSGAGRLGIGQFGEREGFQIGQRPDFFEARVGLETTVNRPVINTRDEPHADPRAYRRLHVITGDANLSEVATFVKVGSAQLVLAALAEGAELPELVDPVAAFRAFSHDPTLRATARLVGGGSASALELQRRYLDAAAQASGGVLADRDAILQVWDELLDDLDADPLRCADRLDWVAKLRLFTGLRARQGLSWAHPKLAAIDLQYADLAPGRSLFATLERAGHIRRLTTEAEVEAAVGTPPASTRAWLRGTILRRFPDAVVAANWDSVTLELTGGRVVTLRLPDPLDHTAATAGEAVERSGSAEQLLAALDRGASVDRLGR